MNTFPDTIEAALSGAADRFTTVGESPRLDAEVLLAWVLHVPRSYLFTHPEEILTRRSARDFERAVSRREGGQPVAYITGCKEFWSLKFRVTADTLIPRPETETLVEQALAVIPQDRTCRILDLGAGSGAIAIAIASERPACDIVATDISHEALSVARDNAHRHGIRNIRFSQGDYFEPVSAERFDVIVSNPPYVRTDDPVLDDLRFEPRAALVAGPDGLDAICRIASEGKRVLKENGTLLLEHAADQKDSVRTLLTESGWSNIRCFPDLSGHLRVTAATMRTTPNRDSE